MIPKSDIKDIIRVETFKPQYWFIPNYRLESVDQRSRRLEGTLRRTELADPVDLQSPLFRGGRRRESLNELFNTLDFDLIDDPLVKEKLIELETSELKKASPLSHRDAFFFRKHLPAYFGMHAAARELEKQRAHARLANLTLDQYFSERWAEYSEPIVYPNSRALDLEFEPDNQFTLNLPWGGYLGSPWFRSASGDTDLVWPEVFDVANNLFDITIQTTTDVAGWRGQEAGHKDDLISKQRLTWMSPKGETAHEVAHVKPLIKKFSLVRGHYCWGDPELLHQRVAGMLQSAYRGEKILVQIDFDEYDHGVQKCMLKTHYADPVADSFGERPNHQVLMQTGESNLLTADGLHEHRKRGLASGKGGTNFAGSMIQKEGSKVASRISKLPEPIDQEVNGDDGLYELDMSEVEFRSMWMPAWHEIGFRLNPSKQSFSNGEWITYLQRMYFRKGPWGVRSLVRTANRMGSYEHFRSWRWSGANDILRWWTQLEEVRYHPLRLKLLDWVLSHDKYRLGEKYPGRGQGVLTDAGDKHISELAYESGLKPWKLSAARDMRNWWIFDHLNVW